MEPSDQRIQEQLSVKRHVLFWLTFSIVGLVCGWPFATPSVFTILQYRATWAVFTAVMLLCTIAVDGQLWMMRNPKKMQADYYRRKRWWLHALDWEFQFGKTNARGNQQ
ncbi:hypothetical protein LGM14_26995 [Burkholderia multivorans]|nr:hypothetical protein [Burkholderia multivorans]